LAISGALKRPEDLSRIPDIPSTSSEPTAFFSPRYPEPEGPLSRTESSTPSSYRLVSKPLSHGVSFPSTYSNATSDQRRACLTRLCCAFRFSQPHDASFRSRPFSLVSCRFRPWDLSSQRFPPSCSHHGSHRSLSICLEFRPPWSLHRSAPKSFTLALPRSDSPCSCSEERPRSESSKRNLAQGLMHQEGPFTTKRFYPNSVG
jgi:hypothetical protein